MIKPSLRPVSTIQWKIFLSNQVNFLIGQECFLQKLKMGHISSHIAACWYNLYINPVNLFNDIFPVCKVRLTKRYGLWQGYIIGFLKNKNKQKLSAAKECAYQHARNMRRPAGDF